MCVHILLGRRGSQDQSSCQVDATFNSFLLNPIRENSFLLNPPWEFLSIQTTHGEGATYSIVCIFTSGIFYFSLFYFAPFHVSDYILFSIVNLYQESFLILYFNFHPSTSYDVCFARRGDTSNSKNITPFGGLIFNLFSYRKYVHATRSPMACTRPDSLAWPKPGPTWWSASCLGGPDRAWATPHPDRWHVSALKVEEGQRADRPSPTWKWASGGCKPPPLRPSPSPTQISTYPHPTLHARLRLNRQPTTKS